MKKILVSFIVLTNLLYAIDVTVSILPQKYFVEKIAGDKVEVTVMVEPGFSPATYEPRTSQMKKLSKSSAYFSIGVAFERVWLERFKSANSQLFIVDTSKGIKKIEIAEHAHHEEESPAMHKDEHEKHDEHEEDNEHAEHEGLDPHIWLDPILVKIQAKNILDALSKIDAINQAFYLENYEKFIKELDALNHEIHEILEPIEHKAFMVFHPSWGYFANRYHLEQVAVETQGKEPKPRELAKLMKEAKEEGIKVVFVAPQFSQKSAKIIARNIKGNVVTINPLAYDYQSNLINTAKIIYKSYVTIH